MAVAKVEVGARKGETNSSFQEQKPGCGHTLNDGELLQGLNYLCNNGLMVSDKKLCSRVRNTLVTLTHPYPLVTFRLKPFLSRHFTREGTHCAFPEVT